MRAGDSGETQMILDDLFPDSKRLMYQADDEVAQGFEAESVDPG